MLHTLGTTCLSNQPGVRTSLEGGTAGTADYLQACGCGVQPRKVEEAQPDGQPLQRRRGVPPLVWHDRVEVLLP